MSNTRRVPIVIDQETGYATDTGCQVSPSCLRCPLPACRYDEPIWYEDWKRGKESREKAP